MRLLKTLLAAIFFTAGASAQEPVSVSGFDDMSCGAWSVSEADPATRDVYVAWIKGLISGYNYANTNNQIMPEQIPSNGTIQLYVDKYCLDNPLNGFAAAAFQLIRELRSRSNR